jgi:hypothetical protein
MKDCYTDRDKWLILLSDGREISEEIYKYLFYQDNSFKQRCEPDDEVKKMIVSDAARRIRKEFDWYHQWIIWGLKEWAKLFISA